MKLIDTLPKETQEQVIKDIKKCCHKLAKVLGSYSYLVGLTALDMAKKAVLEEYEKEED